MRFKSYRRFFACPNMLFLSAGPLKNLEILDSYPQVRTRAFRQSWGRRSRGQNTGALSDELLPSLAMF
jgi:hypothetical protein